MDYTMIFFSVCLAIILASQIQPLEWLKKQLGLDTNSTLYSQYILINLIINGLRKLLNCAPCLSFWLSLYLMKSFQVSIIVYVITLFISSRLSYINFN